MLCKEWDWDEARAAWEEEAEERVNAKWEPIVAGKDAEIADKDAVITDKDAIIAQLKAQLAVSG